MRRLGIRPAAPTFRRPTMSDYESLALVYSQVTLILTELTIFISIVFSFLVVSYLVAQKLTRSMAAVLVTLFTIVVLISTAIFLRTSTGLVAFVAHLREAVAAGTSGLDWHPLMTSSGGSLTTLNYLTPSLFVLTYIVALVFFFQQRRAGTKAAA